MAKPFSLPLPKWKGFSPSSKEKDIILIYPTSVLKYSLSLDKTISLKKKKT
jgi:hypothetical protein